jgi:hypothetical protein
MFEIRDTIRSHIFSKLIYETFLKQVVAVQLNLIRKEN